jgi:hypothetical protein
MMIKRATQGATLKLIAASIAVIATLPALCWGQDDVQGKSALQRAKQVVASDVPARSKVEAVAALLPPHNKETTAFLSELLESNSEPELKDEAAIACAKGCNESSLPVLRRLMTAKDAGTNTYLLRLAIGEIERRTGALERGIDISISVSGFQNAGAPGVVTITAENQASEGFARLDIDLPPELSPGVCEAHWTGLLKANETHVVRCQALATRNGAFEIAARMWLRLRGPDGFNAGHRIKETSMRLLVGDAQIDVRKAEAVAEEKQ